MRAGAFLAAHKARLVRSLLGAVCVSAQLGCASPHPRTAPDASTGPSLLPPPPAVTLGPESAELKKLATLAPVDRAPRRALFPGACPHVPVVPPVVPLHLPELVTPEEERIHDPRLDAAIECLSRDENARTTLTAMVQRAGRYRPAIEHILSIPSAWRVPFDVEALIFVENGFIPGKVQPDGSAGLWSLPVEVGKAYGLVITDAEDERRQVEASSHVAGQYLADLHKRFGGWALALYAYGHGYTRALHEIGEEPSLKLEDVVHRLAPAGVDYMFEAIAVATVLANPDRFGLDSIRLDPSLATSHLDAPGLTSFADIAQAAGVTVCELRELNPEYLSNKVPANAKSLEVPRETLARAQEMLVPILYGRVPRAAQTPCKDGDVTLLQPSTGPGPEVVVQSDPPGYCHVRPGDTLETVAHRFHVSREKIASDNALDQTAPLVPGQLLRIRTADDNPMGGN